MLPTALLWPRGNTTEIQDLPGIALFKSQAHSSCQTVSTQPDSGVQFDCTDEGAGFVDRGAENVRQILNRALCEIGDGSSAEQDNNGADFHELCTAGTQTGLGRMLGTPIPKTVRAPMNRTNWACSPRLCRPLHCADRNAKSGPNTASYADSLS